MLTCRLGGSLLDFSCSQSLEAGSCAVDAVALWALHVPPAVCCQQILSFDIGFHARMSVIRFRQASLPYVAFLVQCFRKKEREAVLGTWFLFMFLFLSSQGSSNEVEWIDLV